MTPDTVMELGREALAVTVMLAAPLLLSALLAGLLIGMFQAATQIQDMTLSFIPKLVVLVAALGLSGPWMLRVIVNYARGIFAMVPALAG